MFENVVLTSCERKACMSAPMPNQSPNLEAERIALVAEMERSIYPEVLKLLENLRDRPDGTVSPELEVVESEGTVYAVTK